MSTPWQDDEELIGQLRKIVEAATGSKDSDLAAFTLASWLDAGGWRPVAAGALLIEQPEREDRTWYCDRFGAAAYEPSICADYKHREHGYDCGERLLVKPDCG